MVKKISAYIIVGIIIGTVGISVSSYIYSNDVLSESIIKDEITGNTSLSCKCVAFRLDDIKDDPRPDELQFQIIDFFMKKDIPLTIGIIGNKFGNDSSTVSIIKEYLRENEDKLEIANHGWDHEDFNRFNFEQQKDFIKMTNDKIFEKLGVTPVVFIPPFNRFNQDTIQASKENGITHLSSIATIDKPPYALQNSTFYRLPATSTTGEYSNIEKRIWSPWPTNKTFDYIERSVSNNGFAIVMMHPREFGQFVSRGNALDYSRIQELDLLIDKIKESGWTIVPIGKINLDS